MIKVLEKHQKEKEKVKAVSEAHKSICRERDVALEESRRKDVLIVELSKKQIVFLDKPYQPVKIYSGCGFVRNSQYNILK
jgi:hypothetical protein